MFALYKLMLSPLTQDNTYITHCTWRNWAVPTESLHLHVLVSLVKKGTLHTTRRERDCLFYIGIYSIRGHAQVGRKLKGYCH